MENKNYKKDKEFLSKYLKTVELQSGDKRLLVTPDLQGRVLTSSATGEDGYSFGWLNYDLISSKGHHPDCEKFTANRVTIKGRAFCASCSGLLIGAIAAIVGIVLFSLGFFDLDGGSLWVLAVGEALMLIGLAQIKLGGYVKLAVNALFVVGSFFSLVVADLGGQSLLIDVYLLGTIVFMLWFRILLSEWNNKRICVACGRCV